MSARPKHISGQLTHRAGSEEKKTEGDLRGLGLGTQQRLLVTGLPVRRVCNSSRCAWTTRLRANQCLRGLHLLGQGSATFVHNGSGNKVLHLEDWVLSDAITKFSHYETKVDTDQAHVCKCLFLKNILFMDTDI